MTVPYVVDATTGQSVAGTPGDPTPVVPSHQPGDLLLVVTCNQQSQANVPTVTSINDLVEIDSNDAFNISSTRASASIWAKIADGSEPANYTVDYNGTGRFSTCCISVRGTSQVLSVAIEQVVKAAVQGPGTTADLPGVTTSAGQVDRLWVGLCAYGGNALSTTSGSATGPTGWTDDCTTGSHQGTSNVKNSIALITHKGLPTPGTQSSATTTVSVGSYSQLWSLVIAPPQPAQLGGSSSDSVAAASDLATRTAVRGRTLSELISLPGDLATRTAARGRPLSESIVLPGDVATRTAARTRADSVTLPVPSDTVTVSIRRVRATTDAVEPTPPFDNAAAIITPGGQTYSRIGTDSVTTTDAVTRSSRTNRASLDSLPTLIETATRGQLGALRIPVDTAHGTDVLSRFIGVNRAPSEILTTPFEVLNAVGKHFRNMAENPIQAVTDNLARSGGLFNRNPSDLAGAADTQLVPSQILYRTDNVENIPTTDVVTSPVTSARTNFGGDFAPAVDTAMSYGGNIRFAYEEVGGRVDVADRTRTFTGTSVLGQPVTATFSPRQAGITVWHRNPTDAAPFSGDTASRPPFVRVRTTVDNIPLQGETNVKPVVHNFVLSGDEEVLFRGDVSNTQYSLRRTGSDPIPISVEQAAWHQVKVGSTTLSQPVSVTFVQPHISDQNRPVSENLHAQFAETLSRFKISRRAVTEYAANSATVLGRTTLVQPLRQPVFSQVVFLGVTDSLTFDKRNGRLGSETLPIPADVMTTRHLVATRVVNDFVTGLTDVVVRNTPPRSRDCADTASASDSLVSFRVKSRAASDAAGAIDGYSTYATHPRLVGEALPSAFDVNESIRQPKRQPVDTLDTGDAPVRTITYGRAVGDTATATDMARVNRLGRSATDTYPTSDAATITTQHQINRTGTDLVINGSDAVVSQIRAFRSFIESAPASDGGSTRQNQVFRSFTESAAVVSDSATRAALGLARTGFDIGLAVPSDGVIRLTRSTRVSLESAPASEGVASSSAHFRSFIEVVFQGETATTGVQQILRGSVDVAQGFDLPAIRTFVLTPRTGVDTATSVDSLTRVFKAQRGFVEVAPATDLLAVQRYSFLTGTDFAPGTDSVTRLRSVPVVVIETTYVIEAAVRRVSFTRAVTDAVYGSDDSRRPGQVYFRALGPDAAPASEFAAASYHGYPRSVTDGAQYTGDLAIRAAATKSRTGTDSATLFDQAERSAFGTSRSAADTVPIPVDIAGHQWGAFLRTGDETIPTVSEGDIPPGHHAFVALFDVVTGIASGVRVIWTRRSAIDTVPAAFDGTGAPQFLSRSGIEAIPAPDATPTRLYGAVRNVAEAVPIVEVLVRGGRFWRYPVDMILLFGDSSIVGRNLGRTATEIIPSSIEVATRGSDRFGRALADILATPFDSGTVESPRNRSLLESAPAADVLNRSMRGFRYGIDSVPVADLVSRTNQGISRTASDNAHFSFETLYSNTIAIRLPIEVATAGDVLARLLVLNRIAAEISVFSADQADRSGQFSSLLADTITGGDVGDRSISAIRSAADVASSSAVGIAVRLFRRNALDAATSRDGLLAVRRFLWRSGVDVSTLADFAYRLLDRVRYGLDTAPVIDQGTGARSLSTAVIESIPLGETTNRKAYKIRYGSDILGSFFFPLDVDQVRSRFRGIRSTSETASATDQARRIWQYLRATTDFAPVSDSYVRKAFKIRYGFDRVGGGAEAFRVYQGSRGVIQVAPAADTLQWDTRRGRSQVETLSFAEQLDSSRVRPPKPYGPPEVAITSISRSKLSLESGRNLSVVTFEFDRLVDAWVARAGSSNAFDGTLLDSWIGEETYTGMAMIEGALLRPGANPVAIYGRSATSAEWTRSQSPDLAMA